MGRSALVVLVPAAEPLVAKLRLEHDHVAALGVPAHVTVLHPFRTSLDAAAEAALAEVCASTPAFDVTLADVCRFEPGIVVYLAPSPAEPFADLTRRCVAAFPDCPPYGGAHPDPTPHLTVADAASAATAAALEPVLVAGLPITMRVERLTRLVEDDAGRWAVERSWPLSGRDRPPNRDEAPG